MRIYVFSGLLLVGLFTIVLQLLWPIWELLWLLLVPVLALALYDALQTRHAIWRNYPVIGRGRWIMESVRPYIRQYFLESDTDGAPISRMFRSLVYQRAKGELETIPFGTRVDTYRPGYEWIGHSLAALRVEDILPDLRVKIGGPDCRQPYSASIFNISAMSFGALSQNAILALNHGAQKGRFYHNTGEGSISPYHLQHGGDLVWQIGTSYFGCRDEQGKFDPKTFEQKALLASVKMIEIKLSQGAKPGHGGILPADKNTQEIASIRGITAGTQVDSPPTHNTFDTPKGLLLFIKQLRDLADGKPIGIKLSIGRKSEFIAICKAMVLHKIMPDYIAVDGGEGGTGAAPLEFTNSIGMPLLEALAFVDDCLTGFDLRQHIRIVAAGKVFSGFHMAKNLALGADICNSGRAMMLALGCVQSLMCNTNRCPTGVATQDPRLSRGLVVEDKAERVYQFHARTVHACAEIMAAAGLKHSSELTRTHVFRRASQKEVLRYDQIFPYVKRGSMLEDNPPKAYRLFLDEASPDSFKPLYCLTDINREYCEVERSD